jgi:hypothetical protein
MKIFLAREKIISNSDMSDKPAPTRRGPNLLETLRTAPQPPVHALAQAAPVVAPKPLRPMQQQARDQASAESSSSSSVSVANDVVAVRSSRKRPRSARYLTPDEIKLYEELEKLQVMIGIELEIWNDVPGGTALAHAERLDESIRGLAMCQEPLALSNYVPANLREAYYARCTVFNSRLRAMNTEQLLKCMHAAFHDRTGIQCDGGDWTSRMHRFSAALVRVNELAARIYPEASLVCIPGSKRIDERTAERCRRIEHRYAQDEQILRARRDADLREVQDAATAKRRKLASDAVAQFKLPAEHEFEEC